MIGICYQDAEAKNDRAVEIFQFQKGLALEGHLYPATCAPVKRIINQLFLLILAYDKASASLLIQNRFIDNVNNINMAN